MKPILKSVLVTGGVGFIGSNLVEALLMDERIGMVRVLDNLSNGHLKNLEEFADNNNLQICIGDIRDYETCLSACEGMDLVSHQAALGSVPRSIEDPLTSNEVNVNGTLNIFQAVVKKNVERLVFAASSSTYGDSQSLPKKEDNIGNPLSPYAVTKYVNELYADVFSKTYNFNYIGLRYFNVFGPKQDPNGPYAAVIPLFMEAALLGVSPTINGDGSYSRDFTFVENAVQANIKALFTSDNNALNQIYNVALGQRTTLSDLYSIIKDVTKSTAEPIHGSERTGDIPHSLADISKAVSLLRYSPNVGVKEGLTKTYHWYKKQIHNA